MTPQITTLRNGLRIVSQQMPHLETVSLGVWVHSGARHETEETSGLSHFLEHMAFKGTTTRSARQIAEEIEQVGGELNASTGYETTAFFARVLKGDEDVALRLLADILLNSKFDAVDIERERDVILQEIASADDSPEDIVFDLMHAAAFPGQAAGRPILGSKQTVSRFTAGHLRALLSARYHTGAIVISAAGAIHHDTLVRHVEALFGALIAKRSENEALARYQGGVSAAGKPFEQSHLLIGFPAPSYLDRDFDVAQVFSGLVGGGMSSRLFQEVRENRGLCYAIYSTVWGLRDAGMFAIHAATGHETVNDVASVVASELRALGESGPGESEVERSKAQLKAGLLMALESSSVRAEQMARHLLAYGRVMDAAELVARVDAVSLRDLKDFGSRLLRQTPTISLAGSGKRAAAQAKAVQTAFFETLAASSAHVEA